MALLLLLLALSLLLARGLAGSDSWDAPTRSIRRPPLRTHMSTKTLYAEPTREQLVQDARGVSTDGCEPAQVNLAVRHGTRFPTWKDITRIGATHGRLRASVRAGYGGERREDVPAHLAWLLDWDNPYEMADEGTLAPVGVEELMNMGARVRERYFPKHWWPQYDASRFTFEHTWKLRTKQSAEAFAYGFFDGWQPVYLEAAPKGSDHVLRFYDNCPAFDRAVDKNKSATIQHAKYRKSDIMREHLRRFADQFASPITHAERFIDQTDLEAAYAGCAFDVAVWGREDHWCALFDDEMLLSMDYFHDLKHFYKKGHGNAVSFEIAAPLLQDIVTSMKKFAAGQSTVQGHFRFAHAETILPLVSLLNMSYFDRHASEREGHFLADTPLEVALKRKFAGSALAPFAANIGFVLYQCKPHGRFMEPYFRVRTQLNERDVRFHECGEGREMCTLEQIESIFRRWLLEYDFHLQCAV